VKEDGGEELNGRESSIVSEEATNLAPWQAMAEQDPSDVRKRPTDITLRHISTMEAVVMTASSIPSGTSTNTSDTVCHVQQSSCNSSDDFIHVSLPSDVSSKLGQTRSKFPPTQMTPILPKLSESKENPFSPPPLFSTGTQLTDREDFFTINEMHMCICGQWLCVSNTGGVVMAFDFRLKNSEKKEPKVRAITISLLSIILGCDPQ
jgi:hypothetical protein